MHFAHPWLLVMLVWLTATASAQEQYELTVPGRPDLTSRAVLEGARLVITDATGSSFSYDRHAAFDTPDGELIGYRSLTAGTSLRWPVLGAGSMWLGDLAGTMWRRSQQSVNRIGVAPGGALGLPGPGPTPILGPGGIACLPGAAGAWTAHIGGDGRLRCYFGKAGSWAFRETPLGTPLIPGAPLALYSTPGAWPGILTVGPGGRLMSITDGSAVAPLAGTVSFPPGAHVEFLKIGPRGHAFVVDVQGRLWDVDVDTHTAQMVEPKLGVFPPGAPLAALLDGATPLVISVNHSSVMVAYTRTGGGWVPSPMGAGFTPGTHLTSARLLLGGTPTIQVAAVNWAGQLQIWSKSTTSWDLTTIPTVLLAPGSPVEIGTGSLGPLLSAIGADGVWHAWSYVPMIGWKDVAIGPGYSLGAPLAMMPGIGTLFTVDSLGRLVIAEPSATGWGVSFVHPALKFAPQLLSRKVIPNPDLPPARMTLVNSSPDDLIVQIVDQFQPRQPEEIKIPAGGQVVRELARDSGSTLEETHLIPGPGGLPLQQTIQQPLPPQQRFSIVAWSDKVTYRYIDKRRERPQGTLPSFDVKTHTSLGVIPIPPGPQLRDTESIDIPAVARRINNPGAVRFYPQPTSPPVSYAKPSNP